MPSSSRGRRRANPADPRATTSEEAVRVLRSNLQVTLSDLASPVVVVTSALAGEGKTSITVNLAKSLATAGAKVVLVDVDLRRPDAHRLLGAHNELGLTDALLQRESLERCLQYVQLPATTSNAEHRGMYFLAAGSTANNPTELLGSGRIARMFTALAAQADVVLLDTPPVLPVADTLVIGRLAAGAVLVVEARRTPTPAVMRAKNALTRNQTRILGVVLNRMQARDAATVGGYGYGYGYGYGSPSPQQSNGAGANGSGPKKEEEQPPPEDRS